MFIDLYQLTMAATYFSESRMNDLATFDLFVRRLPPERNYMVFAGLASVIEHLETFHFTAENIDYLRSLDLFSEGFLKYLKNFKFTGQVESLSEGEIFFDGEPIIKVTAPLIEAQIIETSLINIIHLHSLIATKAARIISAAKGRSVIDFGARRSHGQDAAMAAAYASYLVGADGTSNISAGERYHIPVYGTMAHSYIQSFPSESDAFTAYLKQYPKRNTLLIDTYNPLVAAQLIGDIAQTQALTIQAVRIDSGDLIAVTKKVREILNERGLQATNIFLSGDLDERIIEDFDRIKLPVDGFGVGTKMDISVDAPYLEMVYKLSNIQQNGAERRTMKDAAQKQNLPGRKQIYRQFKNAFAVKDIVGLDHEKLPGIPLLKPIIKNGLSISKQKSLHSCRKAFQERIMHFPAAMFAVNADFRYAVTLSEELQLLVDTTRKEQAL